MIKVLLKMDFRLEATLENPFPRPKTLYKLTDIPALPTIGMTFYIAYGRDSESQVVAEIGREVDRVCYSEIDKVFVVRLSPWVVESNEKEELEDLIACGWTDKTPDLSEF